MTRALQRVYPLLDRLRAGVTEMKSNYAMVIHPDQFQVEVALQAALAKIAGKPLTKNYDLD